MVLRLKLSCIKRASSYILTTHFLGTYIVTEHVQRSTVKLHVLKRIQLYLSDEMKRLCYNAYILPIMEYCCVVRGHKYKTKTCMFKLQSPFARIILNSCEQESRYIFQQLNWLPFSHRYTYHVAVLVFKSLNGLEPIYINDLLTLSSNERYQLRSITKTNWTISKPKTNWLKKAFSYTACKVWNEIPVTM